MIILKVIFKKQIKFFKILLPKSLNNSNSNLFSKLQKLHQQNQKIKLL